MEPHPRIRKTIKWGGAALTVLLVMVWIGSGWWCVRIGDGRPYNLQFDSGRVFFFHFSANSITEGPLVTAAFHEFGMLNWIFEGGRMGPDFAAVFPIWLLCLASAAATIGAFAFDRILRKSLPGNPCPKCNYDRTGLLQDAKCPECGAASASV